MLPFLKRHQLPVLEGSEGVDLLRSMAADEAFHFVRRAADIAEHTENLNRGLRDALRERKAGRGRRRG